MTKQTPLYNEHLRQGARMVDFAGWSMPVQYTGVIEEHLAVRQHAGLFDVSHMGEIEVTGGGALAFVQYLTANDVRLLVDGAAQYSMFCNERGTIIDDIIVYRLATERFIIVVNASNREKDFSWVKEHATGNVSVRDVSDDYALIALQGPTANTIFKKISRLPINDLASFHFCEGEVAGQKNCIVSKTGYTGEPGCEIFCSSSQAAPVWQALLAEGKNEGILPAGLGARDTLRLEMCYSLYGHEISDETNPLEAGLGWVVKLGTPAGGTTDDFIGKKALLDIKARGLTRKLVGFKMLDRGIPRGGYTLSDGGKNIGHVTSGTMSPSLHLAIGLGYVPTSLAREGAQFSVDIRNEARRAEIVKIPFYKKA